ncbi:conserved hypothetical protein [Ricinus communis]|uniref:Uncharacterized protein n=1 Tax=Ricinus communis TaxID=3988 RepID=B9RWY3_RICCO|nr:conserved hypothetical protein [Ricinus communis]
MAGKSLTKERRRRTIRVNSSREKRMAGMDFVVRDTRGGGECLTESNSDSTRLLIFFSLTKIFAAKCNQYSMDMDTICVFHLTQ